MEDLQLLRGQNVCTIYVHECQQLIEINGENEKKHAILTQCISQGISNGQIQNFFKSLSFHLNDELL